MDSASCCILHLTGKPPKMPIPHDPKSWAAYLGIGALAVALWGAQAQVATPAATPRAVLDQYCVTCHNQKLRTAGLALDGLDVLKPAANADVWERVVARLRGGSMPPPGVARPDAV